MLNRRYLRIKVLQALYAWHQGGNDLVKSEKEMFKSTGKVYDLYIKMISLLLEIVDIARLHLDNSKEKQLPSENDLNPNTRFTENPVIEIGRASCRERV